MAKSKVNSRGLYTGLIVLVLWAVLAVAVIYEMVTLQEPYFLVLPLLTVVSCLMIAVGICFIIPVFRAANCERLGKSAIGVIVDKYYKRNRFYNFFVLVKYTDKDGNEIITENVITKEEFRSITVGSDVDVMVYGKFVKIKDKSKNDFYTY